uniref:EF-hand domain-containing protein n=1 Tax=Eutreptiella gymnastica TaxID=73025 RepID=A0A7S1HS04_9EUGL
MSYAPAPPLARKGSARAYRRPPSADRANFYVPPNFQPGSVRNWYVTGNKDIQEAAETVADSTRTWEDIANSAMYLLTDQRESEAAVWQETRQAFHQNVVTAGSKLLPGAAVAPPEGVTPITAILKRQHERVHGQANKTHTMPAAPLDQSCPLPVAAPPVRKRYEPAPWKRRDKLTQLLQEQQEGALKGFEYQEVEPTGAVLGMSRHGRPKMPDPPAATKKRPKSGRKVLPARPNYAQLIQKQQHEMASLEGTYRAYTEIVDELLQEQRMIQEDIQESPWDLCAGPIRDERERLLKRKLLWLIGGCNRELNPEDLTHDPNPVEAMINKELDDIVTQVDREAKGVVTMDELKAYVEEHPSLTPRLQALKVNLALSPANRLRSNNRWRKAQMQIRLAKLRAEADLDGDGYIQLAELEQIAQERPEAMKALARVGIHLRTERDVRPNRHGSILG